MSVWMLYGAAAIGVFSAGVFGAFGATTHVVRRVLGVNIMGGGVFLLLVASARRAPSAIPDPVPHALVLTGIVISVSATALAMAIARALSVTRERDSPAPPRDEPPR
ncbi:MAG: NADH-quinone oxidoreductase subunit K [Labilithrix sp.]|nr:NADH-quinone oxidoreductase subunit K [Labilithrix sp.]MCW5835669.1 NADH-quinone oxidoreductase subunit K [Labilithrix sp.]